MRTKGRSFNLDISGCLWISFLCTALRWTCRLNFVKPGLVVFQRSCIIWMFSGSAYLWTGSLNKTFTCLQRTSDGWQAIFLQLEDRVRRCKSCLLHNHLLQTNVIPQSSSFSNFPLYNMFFVLYLHNSVVYTCVFPRTKAWSALGTCRSSCSIPPWYMLWN